jgi:hypothetical protein
VWGLTLGFLMPFFGGILTGSPRQLVPVAGAREAGGQRRGRAGQVGGLQQRAGGTGSGECSAHGSTHMRQQPCGQGFAHVASDQTERNHVATVHSSAPMGVNAGIPFSRTAVLDWALPRSMCRRLTRCPRRRSEPAVAQPHLC